MIKGFRETERLLQKSYKQRQKKFDITNESLEDYIKMVHEMCSKYNGLRVEDMDLLNPMYSCVICQGRTTIDYDSKEDDHMVPCEFIGRLHASCEDNTLIEPHEFMKRYK